MSRQKVPNPKYANMLAFMNSNGIYAVEKMGCPTLALAKTIVSSAMPQLFIYGLNQ